MYNIYTHIYPCALTHVRTHAHMHECKHTGMYLQKLTNKRAFHAMEFSTTQCEWICAKMNLVVVQGTVYIDCGMV